MTKKILTHSDRVKKWGETPDLISLDKVFCDLLRRFSIDPQDVANEICHVRRSKGMYGFCSRRALHHDKIANYPLRSISPDFPPIRLVIGAKKNAHSRISDLLPGDSYLVEYQSTKDRATYCIKQKGNDFPEVISMHITNSRVSDLIEGMPDERSVLGARFIKKNKKDYLHIHVEGELEEYSSLAVDPLYSVKPKKSGIKFLEGDFSVQEISQLHPDADGNKITNSNKLEIATVEISINESEPEDYIFVLPHGKSNNPTFNLEGFARDRITNAHVAKAKNVSAHRLSHALKRAKKVEINEDNFVQKLI